MTYIGNSLGGVRVYFSRLSPVCGSVHLDIDIIFLTTYLYIVGYNCSIGGNKELMVTKVLS